MCCRQSDRSHLRNHSDGPLATALQNPWLLDLTIATLHDSPDTAARLTTCTDTDTVRELLFAAQIPAAVATTGGSAKYRDYTSDNVEKWLRSLALCLRRRRDSGRDGTPIRLDRRAAGPVVRGRGSRGRRGRSRAGRPGHRTTMPTPPSITCCGRSVPGTGPPPPASPPRIRTELWGRSNRWVAGPALGRSHCGGDAWGTPDCSVYRTTGLPRSAKCVVVLRHHRSVSAPTAGR